MGNCIRKAEENKKAMSKLTPFYVLFSTLAKRLRINGIQYPGTDSKKMEKPPG